MKSRVVMGIAIALGLLVIAALVWVYAMSQRKNRDVLQPCLGPAITIPVPSELSHTRLTIQEYTPPWEDNRPLLRTSGEASLKTPEDAERSFVSATAAKDKEWQKKGVTPDTWVFLSTKPRLKFDDESGAEPLPVYHLYYYRVTIQEEKQTFVVVYFKLFNKLDPTVPKLEEQGYSRFAYQKDGDDWRRSFEFEKTPIFQLLERTDPAILVKKGSVNAR